MYRGWTQRDYQNKHHNINQKDEGTLDDRGRDGGINFILRIKEQETRLTLQEHDDVMMMKITFRDHINYIEEKCTKLIFSLSKSAKITWGLKHETLKTIYTGGILPLLLYGAPVWKSALNKHCYKAKLIRIQRLINIRIAKAYRTVSNEALCVIASIKPIHIKIEEAGRDYEITKGKGIQ